MPRLMMNSRLPSCSHGIKDAGGLWGFISVLESMHHSCCGRKAADSMTCMHGSISCCFSLHHSFRYFILFLWYYPDFYVSYRCILTSHHIVKFYISRSYLLPYPLLARLCSLWRWFSWNISHCLQWQKGYWVTGCLWWAGFQSIQQCCSSHRLSGRSFHIPAGYG